MVAVILTMIAGGIMFALLGKNPFEAIRTIFWDPLFGEFAWYLRGQLLVKAGPLILIAVGLSLGLSRRYLEHRGRRPVYHGRDCRRLGRPCRLPHGKPLDFPRDDHRGRVWRLGLGHDPGDSENPLQHQ